MNPLNITTKQVSQKPYLEFILKVSLTFLWMKSSTNYATGRFKPTPGTLFTTPVRVTSMVYFMKGLHLVKTKSQSVSTWTKWTSYGQAVEWLGLIDIGLLLLLRLFIATLRKCKLLHLEILFRTVCALNHTLDNQGKVWNTYNRQVKRANLI